MVNSEILFYSFCICAKYDNFHIYEIYNRNILYLTINRNFGLLFCWLSYILIESSLYLVADTMIGRIQTLKPETKEWHHFKKGPCVAIMWDDITLERAFCHRHIHSLCHTSDTPGLCQLRLWQCVTCF